MRLHGPLRMCWEGGFKGEGILRYLKPMVKQGTHKITFAKNLLQKYCQDDFLQKKLNLDLFDEETDNEPEPHSKGTGGVATPRQPSSVFGVHVPLQGILYQRPLGIGQQNVAETGRVHFCLGHELHALNTWCLVMPTERQGG